jgi:hypothetical protein
MDDGLADSLDTVTVIKNEMVMREDAVTRDGLPELLRLVVRKEIVDATKSIEDRLMAVESKIVGINRRRTR